MDERGVVVGFCHDFARMLRQSGEFYRPQQNDWGICAGRGTLELGQPGGIA